MNNYILSCLYMINGTLFYIDSALQQNVWLNATASFVGITFYALAMWNIIH